MTPQAIESLVGLLIFAASFAGLVSTFAPKRCTFHARRRAKRDAARRTMRTHRAALRSVKG